MVSINAVYSFSKYGLYYKVHVETLKKLTVFSARIGRTFLHRTQGYEKGVRPIHKARNLGCFTSSAQATPRSQIDDQPLPQPVSITARV